MSAAGKSSDKPWKKLTSMEGRASWRQVPPGIRVGGAFMALGLVLLVFGVIELFTSGMFQPFPITPGFLMILVAAIILGAFATTSKYEKSSKAQVIALAVAVALAFFSVVLPSDPIAMIEQFWISAWGVAALLCGLIIRRALLPKA